jgi:hypothetical protein
LKFVLEENIFKKQTTKTKPVKKEASVQDVKTEVKKPVVKDASDSDKKEKNSEEDKK